MVDANTDTRVVVAYLATQATESRYGVRRHRYGDRVVSYFSIAAIRSQRESVRPALTDDS